MTFSEKLINAFRSDKENKGKIFSGNESTFHGDWLRTGIAPIDYSLGGGFPYGRGVEIFGNWSSGKTWLLYVALAANQRAGGTSALLESEGAFDPQFFLKSGGDPGSLIFIPVTTVEEVFTHAEKTCRYALKEGKGEKICLGWDGIALTGTSHLQEAGMDKRDMSKAGSMSQGTALVATLIAKTRVCFIATNQTRQRIGSKDSATHTPGGEAWPFFCSQRIELCFDGGSKTSLIKGVTETPDGKEVESADEVGRWVKMKVVKNKVASPFLGCSIPFYNFEDRHPIYGYTTRQGADFVECLWDFYTQSRFYLGDPVAANRVILSPSSGWYCLHPSLDPTMQKFRAASWPDILAAMPRLWNLAYERPQIDSGERTQGDAGEVQTAASGA